MCHKHLSNKYLYMVFYNSSQHLQMHMTPTSRAVLNFPPMSNITLRNFSYLPFSPLIPTKSTVNKTASLEWVPSKAGAKWWGPFLFFFIGFQIFYRISFMSTSNLAVQLKKNKQREKWMAIIVVPINSKMFHSSPFVLDSPTLTIVCSCFPCT